MADTQVQSLIINTLTKAQFDSIESPSSTELYFVEEDETITYAQDSAVVHKQGTEVIDGQKTFTGNVILDNATATTPQSTDNSNKVATTAYVQTVIASLLERIEALENAQGVN